IGQRRRGAGPYRLSRPRAVAARRYLRRVPGDGPHVLRPALLEPATVHLAHCLPGYPRWLVGLGGRVSQRLGPPLRGQAGDVDPDVPAVQGAQPRGPALPGVAGPAAPWLPAIRTLPPSPQYSGARGWG